MKTLALIVTLVPAAHCFQSEDEQIISRTLHFSAEAQPRSLLVDNSNGSISVSAHDGDAVEFIVHRRTQFKSPDHLQEANEDVQLEIRERRNRIEAVVDAPWRNRWKGDGFYGYTYDGYEVKFDFTIKVPRNVNLFLRTVNDGDIEVQGVEGEFELNNVNGSIIADRIAGSGRFIAVNGSLRIGFEKNPDGECLFRTINGKIEATFRESLSADLLLKTFNGNAYTDFDVVSLPALPPVVKSGKGRMAYKAGDFTSVRAGKGGPRLGFDTLNGCIYILKHE
ncbi:MAG TPA: hypothetical protein VGA55_03160 [Bacteroidota bacterium]